MLCDQMFQLPAILVQNKPAWKISGLRSCTPLNSPKQANVIPFWAQLPLWPKVWSWKLVNSNWQQVWLVLWPAILKMWLSESHTHTPTNDPQVFILVIFFAGDTLCHCISAKPFRKKNKKDRWNEKITRMGQECHTVKYELLLVCPDMG